MVDVEQGRLATLEEHGLTGVECLAEQQRGVDGERSQPVGEREEPLGHLIDRDRPTVVDLDEQVVLLFERALDLLAQDLLVEQVLHAHADARHLVGVGRTDAAAGGAVPAPRKRSATLSMVR